MKKKIFRIIDANLNRSREGLRVCEEIARFALDDEALTRGLKLARHRISLIAKEFETNLGSVSSSRESRTDVGRSSRIKGGMSRKSLSDVFAANIERVKESLRVLEEFFQLVNPPTSSKFSKIRFNIYDIEKRVIQKIAPVRNRRQGAI